MTLSTALWMGNRLATYAPGIPFVLAMLWGLLLCLTCRAGLAGLSRTRTVYRIARNVLKCRVSRQHQPWNLKMNRSRSSLARSPNPQIRAQSNKAILRALLPDTQTGISVPLDLLTEKTIQMASDSPFGPGDYRDLLSIHIVITGFPL